MRPIICISILLSVSFMGCERAMLKPDHACSSQPFDPDKATYKTLQKFNFYGPAFNPNDPNEFVYATNLTQTSSLVPTETSLWKYNLSTEKKELITHDASPLSSPDWSTTDWILFSGPEFELWKIKSNGDSLTKLNINRPDRTRFFGSWNPGGNKIIVGAFSRTLILSQDGDSVGTLGSGDALYYPAWSPDGKWIAAVDPANPSTTLAIFSTESTEIRRIALPLREKLNNSIFSWFPDSKKLVMSSATAGVFILDLDTEIFKEIIEGCGSNGSRQYGKSSVSPSGDKIIISRIDIKAGISGGVKRAVNIIEMDIDGSNKKLIDLSKD